MKHNITNFKNTNRKYIYNYSKTINHILNHVDDDYYSFKDFSDTDFGKTGRLKVASAVSRFIDYRIYQGKSFKDALDESLTITKSIRSYRQVLSNYKDEVFKLEAGGNFTLNNLSTKLLGLTKAKGSSWTSLQYLRGRLVQCCMCKKYMIKRKNSFFCSTKCDRAYPAYVKAYIESHPELMKMIDELANWEKYHPTDWSKQVYSPLFYNFFDNNKVFFRFYQLRHFLQVKLTGMKDLPDSKFESEESLYVNYLNFLMEHNVTESDLVKKYIVKDGLMPTEHEVLTQTMDELYTDKITFPDAKIAPRGNVKNIVKALVLYFNHPVDKNTIKYFWGKDYRSQFRTQFYENCKKRNLLFNYYVTNVLGKLADELPCKDIMMSYLFWIEDSGKSEVENAKYDAWKKSITPSNNCDAMAFELMYVYKYDNAHWFKKYKFDTDEMKNVISQTRANIAKNDDADVMFRIARAEMMLDVAKTEADKIRKAA